jgi:hydrogenase nickel incorporation protein HypB
MTTIVELQDAVMRKNDDLAAALRARFAKSGTFVLNFLSSPGSGKTTLLEETVRRLSPTYRCAILVGDQATNNDANRLARAGAPVYQISTGAECRLDATMIGDALTATHWKDDELDILCIENVGNLICPAEYDLGEDLRVALFSVTEGEDKPQKYPLAFNTAHVALITKTDIAEAVGFDGKAAHASLDAVHPGIATIELSARTGAGMDAWIALLEQRIGTKKSVLR